jgi:peptidoglycan/xylan/chitin deacetylase (PgdA/CDA1 family)
MNRRAFLGAGAAAALATLATACGDDGGQAGVPSSTVRTTTGPPTPTAPPAPSTTSAPTGPARFVFTGPTTKPRFALTFHTNGDLGLAQQLLDVLAARQVHITAFIVGNWLDANPSWASKLIAAGHEVANHTYTHLDFATLPQAQMVDEVTRCRDVLLRLTGSPGAFFRPSGTDDGTSTPSDQVLAVAGAAGYHTVLGFDVDPLDYDDPGSAVVTQRTLASAKAGSIVSLHFGHPGTIAAMPAILDGLTARGLTPVTASQLLAA